MGLLDEHDKLLKAVHEQATQDREKILAQAQEQIRHIEAQTQTDLEQIQSDIETQAQKRVQQQMEQHAGQAQVDYRRSRQAIQQRHLLLTGAPESPTY